MRSRSSRLFIVLLHLVGVSTNLPHNIWGRSSPYWQGIVGVNPMAIFLESLQLEAAGGLDGLLMQLSEAGYSPDDVLSEPYWLQDDSDGKCFGPGGFSDCGDATLWLVRKRRSTGPNTGVRKGSSGDANGQAWGYALELIDGNLLSSHSSASASASASAKLSRSTVPAPEAEETRPGFRWRRNGNAMRKEEGECLISSMASSSNAGGHQQGIPLNVEQNLKLGSCTSDEAWVWRINGDGVLVQDEGALELARQRQQPRRSRVWGDHGEASNRLKGGEAVVDRIRQLILGSILQLEPSRTEARDNSITSSEEARTRCVWRINATEAAAAPCHVSEATIDASTATPVEVKALRGRTIAADPSVLAASSSSTGPQVDGRDASMHLVRFSLIRYQASASSSKLPALASLRPAPDASPALASHLAGKVDNISEDSTTSDECDTHVFYTTRENAPLEACRLPSSPRIKQRHASGPAMHPELKPASQLLFTSLSPSGKHSSQRTKPPGKRTATLSSHLAGASPLTLGAAASTQKSQRPGVQQSPSSHDLHRQNRHLLHHPPAPFSPGDIQGQLRDDLPHKPRKIPTHSYIEASNDGIWVDPDTGLEYLTDLSGYLGHDRKETGRHTLVGVGQYTRTVFKIKVYGCALYIAKRDALADPGLVPFAALSSEELRSSNDFYNHLLTNDSTDGSFDRTLFIKTNMQLATEVMRNSLDADWKLLTPEHKHMLISSSLNPRDAEEQMLRMIQSDDNPSRCSCGQVAPEEYGADATCCTRGTELVFTWRKNGNLELRLDGRIMDIFPDAELARGIFYEYLREDDPMSMQARDNFADGFPFLLAPLAQIRGVTPPVLSSDSSPEGPKQAMNQKEKRILRLFCSVSDVVNSHVALAADWAQSSAEEIRSNSINVAKAVSNSARNLATELEKQRVMTWDHIMRLPDEASQQIISRIPFLATHLPIRGNMLEDDELEESEPVENVRGILNRTNGSTVCSQMGRLIRPQQEETDEIGIMINPRMNFTHRLFLYLVHFYLMLLFIVSVPRSYSTRLVVKRAGGSRSKCLTDEDLCSESAEGRRTPPIHGLQVSVQLTSDEKRAPGMTKSLSYYI